MIDYKVQKGDTLWSISHTYNTTIPELVALNNIKNPDLIHVGQILRIPAIDPEASLADVLNSCLDALEKLPEFKALEELLDG